MTRTLSEWKKTISRAGDLSCGARLLALRLAMFMTRDRWSAWPKHRTLAVALAMKTRTVRRHVAELIEHGWLHELSVEDQDRRIRGYGACFPSERLEDETVRHIEDETVRHSREEGGQTVSKNRTKPSKHSLIGKPKEVDTPPGLNVDAWEEWVAFRREANFRKLSPRSVQAQQKKLAELDAGEQQRIIDYSVMNGYQGLFPEKVVADGKHGKKLSTVDRVRRATRVTV